MRAVSQAFVKAMEDNSTLLVKANVTYADGSTQALTGDDICSMSVESASSSSGSFDIGAAIIGQLSITLNNYDDRFSERDFTDAVIVPHVGKTVADETTEWVRLGTYTIDQPDSYAGQVSLTALDNLSKLEKSFSTDLVSWPCSLDALVDAVCHHCGIASYDGLKYPDYKIPKKPQVNSASCLDVIGYVAQMTGSFAVANQNGGLEFRWYESWDSVKEAWLNGGEFDTSYPYSSGDSADGGDFTYTTKTSYDGGDFESLRSVCRITRPTSLTVFTDDVVITGLKVTASNQVIVSSSGDETNGEDGETALYGSEGYVLSISSNPLIIYGEAATVANMIASRIIGLCFRPFSCDTLGDPTVEPGDFVLITDRKGNVYRSYANSVTMKANGSTSVECSAESASRNSASSASAATKALIAARSDLKREQSAREAVVEELKQTIENSSGLYTTEVVQEDGSVIYYLHNKKSMDLSDIIWKMTAEAVAVSHDYGKTYSAGISADGTAILERLSVTGLDASVVNITNLMTIGDETNGINLSGTSIDFTLNDKAGALTITPSSHGYTGFEVQNEDDPKNAVISATKGKTVEYTSGIYPGNPHHPTVPESTTEDGVEYLTFFYFVKASIYHNGNYDLVLEKGTVKIAARELRDKMVAEWTIADETDYSVAVMFAEAGAGCDSGFTITLHPTSTSAYLYYAELQVWGPELSSSIQSATTGEHYINDQNFGRYVNGGELLTGVISFPFMWNNIYRTFFISVKDGLITNYRIS